MRLEITYLEIHEILSNKYHLNIGFSKIDENIIKIKEEKIFFDYEVNGVVNIIAGWFRSFNVTNLVCADDHLLLVFQAKRIKRVSE